jgi:hypothetical protein
MYDKIKKTEKNRLKYIRNNKPKHFCKKIISAIRYVFFYIC